MSVIIRYQKDGESVERFEEDIWNACTCNDECGVTRKQCSKMIVYIVIALVCFDKSYLFLQ